MFLIPLTGWPHSLFDWDILFLLPLPWWGQALVGSGIGIVIILLRLDTRDAISDK